ncbi:MAG: c-type cytochrome [Gammaproteobacteria bacterium]|nr:c-type cytochrome [Gammaproteobacteria bacterium]
MSKFFIYILLFFSISLGHAKEFEIDLDLGEEINEVCAGCHGEYGEGGKQGEYPRLAGLPAEYIIQQLKLFKEEKRKNMPMRPYANERELPDEDIPSIAAFLSQIELTSQMPDFDEDMPAYEKLLIAKKVFNIPKAEGDIALGEKIYKTECKSCHGDRGLGKKNSNMPQLTGQYTEYMLKQMKQIAHGQREHDDDADVFAAMKAKEIQAIMAYLSVMDD